MRRGTEYIVVGTGRPTARAWGLSAGEAATLYARAFRPSAGANVLTREVAAPEVAEAFRVTTQGLQRLAPGAVK